MENLNETKELLAKASPKLVLEIADVSNAYLSDLLNDKKPANSDKAKLALKVAKELGEGLNELEEKLREKYKLILDVRKGEAVKDEVAA